MIEQTLCLPCLEGLLLTLVYYSAAGSCVKETLMQPATILLWVLLTRPCLGWCMLSYEYKWDWKQRMQLSTGSVASGDTSAAISQVNVQIQYNNMTIHARKTSCSYNALCTLVEEEWPSDSH